MCASHPARLDHFSIISQSPGSTALAPAKPPPVGHDVGTHAEPGAGDLRFDFVTTDQSYRKRRSAEGTRTPQPASDMQIPPAEGVTMTRKLVGSITILAACLLVAGCGAGGTNAADASAGIDSGLTAETLPAGVATADTKMNSNLVSTPQVIRTAYVDIRVADVAVATAQIVATTTARAGSIDSQSANSDGTSSFANIVARVPSDTLDAFIANLSELGTVMSVNINAQDVTTQVVDLDARIGVLRTSIDRLKVLQGQATSVADLVAVESELANRQGELDSLTAQRTYLGQQVTMSTVTVSLSPITELTSSTAPGFLAGLQNGWSAFLALIAFLITSAGFLIPFVVIGAIIVIPVITIVIKRKR